MGSRYYNPKIGRFINADNWALLGANGDFTSYNLFTYCANSPVIRKDSNGTVHHLVIVAAIGAVAGFAGQMFTDIATSIISKQVVVSGWQSYLGATIGGAAGFLAYASTGDSTFSNAVTGMVSTGVSMSLEKLTTDNYDDVSWGDILTHSAYDGLAAATLGVIPDIPGLSMLKKVMEKNIKIN